MSLEKDFNNQDATMLLFLLREWYRGAHSGGTGIVPSTKPILFLRLMLCTFGVWLRNQNKAWINYIRRMKEVWIQLIIHGCRTRSTPIKNHRQTQENQRNLTPDEHETTDTILSLRTLERKTDSHCFIGSNTQMRQIYMSPSYMIYTCYCKYSATRLHADHAHVSKRYWNDLLLNCFASISLEVGNDLCYDYIYIYVCVKN